MGTQLKINLKYLNYISRRGLVKLPTPTFEKMCSRFSTFEVKPVK